jgi:crotonobetainyl-CoA:carnitine CoA-transferase CaiB-like acyl-CoA transferase
LAVADLSAGLYCALGILASLHEREVSGRGQWVHSSLLHAQIAMMDFQVARFINEGSVPVQEGNNHPTSSPMGLFTASDGPFNLGASGQGNWKRLCELLGKPEWLADPEFSTEVLRVAHRPRLNGLLNQAFATQTVQHWVDQLNQVGVPAGPVYTVPQVMQDPQVQHLGVSEALDTPHGRKHYITQAVTLSRTPAEVRTPAPGWGEHTDAVLTEIGYSSTDIAQFHAQGVV